MHAIQTADFSSRLKREFISKNNVSLKQPELKTAVGLFFAPSATDKQGTLWRLMIPCLRLILFVSAFLSRKRGCHEFYRQLPMYTCVSLKKRPVPESAASVRTSEKNAVFLSSKDGTWTRRWKTDFDFSHHFYFPWRLSLTSEQTCVAVLQFLFLPGAPTSELKLACSCNFLPNPTTSQAKIRVCVSRKPAEAPQK